VPHAAPAEARPARPFARWTFRPRKGNQTLSEQSCFALREVDRARASHSARLVQLRALVAKLFSVASACSALLGTTPAANAESPYDARERERREERAGVHGGFLAALGFPRALSFEGLFDVERTISFGAEYGALPKTALANLDLTAWSLAANARVFPFRNGFFLGLRGGYQVVDVGATVSVASFTATERVSIGSSYLNPRIGVLFTWKSGFAVGFDAGVQLPMTSSVSSTIPPGSPVEERVFRAASRWGSTVLPTFDLLRIGFVP
jgi:hypothetical protein